MEKRSRDDAFSGKKDPRDKVTERRGKPTIMYEDRERSTTRYYGGRILAFFCRLDNLSDIIRRTYTYSFHRVVCTFSPQQPLIASMIDRVEIRISSHALVVTLLMGGLAELLEGAGKSRFLAIGNLVNQRHFLLIVGGCLVEADPYRPEPENPIFPWTGVVEPLQVVPLQRLSFVFYDNESNKEKFRLF
ncbi:hypothetical protein Dimus_036848 [Dionaea muscipula]